MSGSRRLMALALCVGVTCSMIVPSIIRAGSDGPATAPATAPAARDLKTISAELQAAGKEFSDAVPSPKMLGDAKFRKDNAEKILPSLRKIAGLLNEIAVSQKEPEAAEARFRMLGMAVALGDKDSAKALADVAAGKNADEAVSAKCALALGNWVSNSADAKAQEKVLEDYTVVVKTDPKEDRYAGTLMIMAQLGAANDDMAKKAMAVIHDNLTGDVAQQVTKQSASIDKPIVIAGRTTTDAKFTSTSMKGKVVLLDFWATWCGPCKASLPEVKKLYQTYHEKGLEIVGIDCDGDDDTVTSFTKENAMPWIQLREKTQDEQENWHPLTKKYGVDGIPTMFLIDKKGVLRYIDAREDTEDKVKKLLAEPEEGAKGAAGK